MATIHDEHRITYRWGQRTGVGYVAAVGEAAKYGQGVLVLDNPDNVGMPWFEARMADIEIVSIDDEARALLTKAGYRLAGL